MFDFINDDERIIFTAIGVIAFLFVVGVVLIVFISCKFLLSRRKLKITESQGHGSVSGEEYDVFISYSHQDGDKGNWLADALRKASIRVFLSSSELAAGDNFSEEIKEALRDAGELWVLASPRSLESEWVMTEWGAAWAMGKRVVPVLHNCSARDLPERLAALHTVSLADIDLEVLRLKTRLETDR